MSDETGFWVNQVRPHLAPYGKLTRVENAAEPGTPDVAYCLNVPARPPASGWLELKHLAAWPVGGTPLVIRSLTLEQVLWLEGWTAAGGRAELLLRVDVDVVLLRASAVRAVYQRELSSSDVLNEAAVFGRQRFPTRELIGWLTRRRESTLRAPVNRDRRQS